MKIKPGYNETQVYFDYTNRQGIKIRFGFEGIRLFAEVNEQKKYYTDNSGNIVIDELGELTPGLGVTVGDVLLKGGEVSNLRMKTIKKTIGFGGMRAAGTLTLTGVVVDGETFFINGETFEFDADGVVKGENIAIDISTYTTASRGTLTVTAGSNKIANGDTVTIDGKVYTFKTTLTTAEGDVLIGENDTAALLNIKNAINLADATGTYVAAAKHPSVKAVSSSATTLVVEALIPGTIGDAIEISETGNELSWDGVKLGTTRAGVDCTAANADGVIITEFNSAANLDITASQGAGTTVIFTCDEVGIFGNSIPVSADMENGSWGEKIDMLGDTVEGVDPPDTDFNFSANDNTQEQIIDLGKIIPAKARVHDIYLVTDETFTGVTTLEADVGSTSGEDEFISLGTIYAEDTILAVELTFSPTLPVTADSKVFVNATPGANWSLMEAGKVSVYVTYLDVATL